jgi:di/tricarboxylate transporter
LNFLTRQDLAFRRRGKNWANGFRGAKILPSFMTFDIAAVLLILAVSLVLFITEKLRMDVVALLVLSALAVGGFVSLEGALAGFNNPAVVTVWSMFILSAGLSATGVADIIGKQVLKMAGTNESRMIIVIMMTGGILSAFMNNIGVAALMLPVVMDIARRTGTSPSRLLMPMAYGTLLGGLTTMVGTPPNLVAAQALQQAGHEGFSLFTFTPIGLPALILGSLFVAFIGKHILPKEMPEGFQAPTDDAGDAFRFSHDLDRYRFRLRLSKDSPLDGQELSQSGLGAILGLGVQSVEREGELISGVDGEFVLSSGDVLSVQGRVEDFRDFIQWQAFEMASGSEIVELLSLNRLVLLSATIREGAEIEGLTVAEADFGRRYHGHIITIRRDGKIIRGPFADHVLQAGDSIQIEMKKESMEYVTEAPDFDSVTVISEESLDQIYRESDSLLELKVPAESHLVGLTIAESGIGDALRMRIIGIGRKSGSIFFPDAEEKFEVGDKLLVHGGRKAIKLMQGLQSLELLESAGDRGLSSIPDEGYTEITLSPQSSLVGKTLRELDFRKRYGLTVLSIWRQGKSYGSHLRNFRLQFGDAMLLSGPHEKLDELSSDRDFLVLSQAAYDASEKASPVRAVLSATIMLAVVIVVLFGWLPIAIAAIAGSTLMIITKCLDIEEAYRAIEWKSVFLIACMIPLGAAMKDTGAAAWLAEGVATVARPFGMWGIIIGLYLMTALATTIVPTAALVLIMAHIGMDAADALNMPPQMIVMAVAMAASASFTSPISHPANVLVMGPGGYRFIDYVKMGLLLALVVMVTVLPLIAWRYG